MFHECECNIYYSDMYYIWCGKDSFKKEKRSMIYLQLFLSFLQVGMFSFGGGYADASSDSGSGRKSA